MKLSKILTAGAFALALVTSAQAAPTYIRIVGSSAYRAATQNAIVSLLNSPTWAFANGSPLNSASAAIFHGTLKNASGTLAAGTELVIQVSWTGSAGGLNTVANNIACDFLPANTALSTGTTVALDKSLITESNVPDIALSDVYKASSGFTGMGSLKEATNSPVGVCAFQWVLTGGTGAAGITNMTPQLAKSLYGAGSLSKALFTGTASDAGTLIYAAGRDSDSGTRLTGFAETGVGVTASVTQYVLGDANSNMVYDATGTQLVVAPEMTVNGVTYTAGNGGYSTGGNLVAAMRYIPSLTGATAVTYLSTGDAGKATAATAGSAIQASTLSYNGVPYSAAAVQNGSYTFWSYEHLYYRTGDKSNAKGLFGNALAGQINTTNAADSGLSLGSMTVQRFSDGGTVSPK